MTASQRCTASLLARLDVLEAHPVMVRLLAAQRLRDEHAQLLAEGRERIEQAG